MTAALRRLHRREPLVKDFRIDAVLAALADAPVPRSPRHRGGVRLELGEPDLLSVLDGLVASGQLRRQGRRVGLAQQQPALDPQMRERVDRLLAGLRETGANPPRVDGPAARLGIPPPVLEQLRRSGELVSAAPGLDFARDSWDAIQERIDALAASGPLTVARVRDGLRTSRRHAEAILAMRRAQTRRSRAVRSRRPGG